LALALIPLSGFAIDIYLPSLPDMGTALHISSNQVQLTITIFLVSYGISQLFTGSIIDSFGRYRIGLSALTTFGFSCIVIATTHNIYLIYLMRIIHGVTVAGVIVAKRAYFIDVFSGDKLKHYLSIFTIIWSAGPILAPFFGGYLQSKFGWQSNFYFLAVFALILALLEFIFSGETLARPTEFNFKKIAHIYSGMITTASFTLGLFMLGISYSLFMVYNLTGPYIIEHNLALSPVVTGYCSLLLGIAWMIGGFAGKATIRRPFYKKLIINFFLQIVITTVMLIVLTLKNNIYTLISFAFILHVTAGYTYNNYFSYSLSQFPQNAGIASGLTGGINYMIVSVLSYGVVYLIPAKDAHNLSYSYFILVVLSAVVMSFVYKVNKKKSIRQSRQ
jgi:MFS family permease